MPPGENEAQASGPMTVAELIDELRELPQHLPVTVWDGPPADKEAHVGELWIYPDCVYLTPGDPFIADSTEPRIP